MLYTVRRNTGCPTADERHEMRYLRNVNKELLRIQTPAPVTFKKCVRAFEVDGYMVPSGHSAFACARSCCRFFV